MKIIKTDRDIQEGLEALCTIDPDIIPIMEKAGNIPLRREQGGFAGLARIIIGQHVSTASAGAIHGRFLEHVTPITPERYLDTPDETRITIGLTKAKQKAIANVAEAILSGSLNLELMQGLEAEAAIRKLTSLKGIGSWTAEIYLLFCIGHPDIFAAGDLAIREAYRHAFKLEERPSEKALRQIAMKWSPHRAVVTRLFWSYYETVKGSGKGLPL